MRFRQTIDDFGEERRRLGIAVGSEETVTAAGKPKATVGSELPESPVTESNSET